MTNVLAIDQGTSGTKAIVADGAGQVLAIAEQPLHPLYFDGGGVEQDPGALLDSVLTTGRRAAAEAAAHDAQHRRGLHPALPGRRPDRPRPRVRAHRLLLRTRHRRRDPRRLRLRHSLRGPAYARRLTAMASDAGAALQATATVTGWAGDRTLEITSPAGRRRTGRWRGSPA